VCFSSEDRAENGPITLFELKDVHLLVTELRWEIGAWTYTDMSPLFLPSLTNLASLALLQVDEDFDYPIEVPKSLSQAFSKLKSLQNLQLEEFNTFADQTLNLDAELPELQSLLLGGWWNHNLWQKIPSRIAELHFIEDWEVYVDVHEERTTPHYLPLLKRIKLDCYLSEESPRQRWRHFDTFLSDVLLADFSEEVGRSSPHFQSPLFGDFG